ncbi:hypothetical protein [Ramlibacter sp.]|uniref:hypothetical protein n=1 Tax=Ramlibacter sp. TaxID=1917967 RepID=UPI003D12E377
MNTPTHAPAQPDTLPSDPPSEEPNPTQLPVEPEFGQALPPLDPDVPGVPQPKI